MKIQLKFAAMLALALTAGFIACNKEKDDSGCGGGLSAGDMETYTAGGVSFRMAHVPGSKTFPTGADDSATAAVANAYWIGETEVT